MPKSGNQSVRATPHRATSQLERREGLRWCGLDSAALCTGWREPSETAAAAIAACSAREAAA
eukprot:865840-Prymnesium_polylepis.1